jgi:predicted nuclease with TOPRIM domain
MATKARRKSMSEEPITFAQLVQYHREVMLPDVQRIVEDSERRLRDEMHGLFDALAQRLDRLEAEYQMLVAGLRRDEERLERVEPKRDKAALRTELLELKARVDGLQDQIRILEGRLSA